MPRHIWEEHCRIKKTQTAVSTKELESGSNVSWKFQNDLERYDQAQASYSTPGWTADSFWVLHLKRQMYPSQSEPVRNMLRLENK